jgi:hypothetical protein
MGKNTHLEVGYRIAAYIDAISTIKPSSLVQPGTVFATPSFPTGTMAINATESKTYTFSFNGPYVSLKTLLN